MSIYHPKTENMRVVFENGAWTVYDQHGPWDGPYLTEGEAWHCIWKRMQWEREHANDWSGYIGCGW